MSLVVERTENLGWPCKKKQHIELSSHSLTHKNKTHISNLTLTCLILPQFVSFNISISLPRHITFHLQQLLWWWCRFPKGWRHHYCTGLKELEMFQVYHAIYGAILVFMTNSRFGGNLQLEARVNSRVMSQWHHLQVVNRRSTLRTTKIGKIAACAPSCNPKIWGIWIDTQKWWALFLM